MINFRSIISLYYGIFFARISKQKGKIASKSMGDIMINLENNCILRNRYEIKDMLDKGGMGSVYLANDVFLDEDVVVKATKIPKDDDELRLLNRMQREYKILHNLDHENIVKARDFFVEDEQAFLVMEYIDANSLRNIIGLYKNFLTIDQKLSIMVDLISTVDYINKNKIVHRDIKPANILMNDKLVPVLVDFGISKPYRTDFETLTKGAAVIGTYDYMSPEQLSSESLTFSDVFSLGVVLYQIFTWQKAGPFHSKTPFQISKNIISRNVTPLADALSYPEEDRDKIQKISHVVSKMMEKKPEERIKLHTALEVLKGIVISNAEPVVDSNIFNITNTDSHDFCTSIKRYEKFQSIGKGSMGEVYKVWDTHLQKEVALKTLISQSDNIEKEKQRFAREASITKELSHPYIVEVYDFGKIKNRYFFTMELLDGELFFKILQEGQSSYRELLEIFTKICQAVEYAHRKKCIHRDLKPENIIILKNGNPKVTDFGLAKIIPDVESLTTRGCIMGTAYYMSPEQALGNIDELDESTDIYALGIMLYLILTGTFPFTGKSTYQILSQTISQRPREAYKINPKLPKSLSDICMKSIEKDKMDRYQSVAQLNLELTKLMRSEF